ERVTQGTAEPTKSDRKEVGTVEGSTQDSIDGSGTEPRQPIQNKQPTQERSEEATQKLPAVSSSREPELPKEKQAQAAATAEAAARTAAQSIVTTAPTI
ncbi:hypothetical protein PMAYCL1PPCAC_28187, partial [Pristionchus mayeri]